MIDKKPNAPAPAAGAKPAANAVIRRLDSAEETKQERIVKKHVPAWVVSGAIHVAVIALAILIFGRNTAQTKEEEKVINTTVENTPVPDEKDLTNPDSGIESMIEANLSEMPEADKTAENIKSNDPVGIPDTKRVDTVAYQPPGLTPDLSKPGTTGESGSFATGTGGRGGLRDSGFEGRGGGTKDKAIKEGGGNDASEQAVALGLIWLAKHQEKDGGWTFDAGSHTKERTCATGFALLPFLAAGQTHKPDSDGKPKKYQNVVKAGLEFLMRSCVTAGPNAGRLSSNTYAQAIASLPIVEAYGMTKDPMLRPYAQAVVNYVQKIQDKKGSWGYSPNAEGDTSIVGWQIQVLAAAKLTKNLVVADSHIKMAMKFLDTVSAGSKKSFYGYRSRPKIETAAERAAAASLTAVGLLCRYYMDGWGPSHPGMNDGVAAMMAHPPARTGGLKDMYYYYYATQVVHFYGGKEWLEWNNGPEQPDKTRKNGMRDWLVNSQVKLDKATPANIGSWEKEAGWFGRECGRLGTTAVALLTLEVYYRHLPLYKRQDAGGIQVLEDK